SLRAGGKYYVTRNMSSLIAFRVPQKTGKGFQVAAAHTDSPAFCVKKAVEKGEYTLLSVEKYGGMIYSTWFDRPLSVAGRVMVRTEQGVKGLPVKLDENCLIIPSLAIHFDREVNQGKKYTVGTDLRPLFGSARDVRAFERRIAEAAGVSPEDILSSDLYLYVRQKAYEWGSGGEFITSPRLDDLDCVYALAKGFLDAEEGEAVSVFAAFHNEEVGSSSVQGADSTFLTDILFRIADALTKGKEEAAAMVSRSYFISADNAHAIHPNHPETADEAGGICFLNKGVVIKHNASGKYATDAFSDALFESLCRENGVDIQHYTNPPDIAGGSTLGKIAGTPFSVPMIDVGLPQLAMHSAVETAGRKDTDALSRVIKAFYSSVLTYSEDGSAAFR
ncbi:MAG: M18 family aminopeptidase, partial [Clostridia bacterium]|nr:M18 family aminopeptidase [Clostridia bacterium]